MTEWVLECPFPPAHEHRYPDDWQFGGADGSDPRSDPRYKPDVYFYISDRFELIHTTVVPLCDDEAVDRFTEVASYGPTFRPKFLQVQRAGTQERVTLPVEYVIETDEVIDK